MKGKQFKRFLNKNYIEKFDEFPSLHGEHLSDSPSR